MVKMSWNWFNSSSDRQDLQDSNNGPMMVERVLKERYNTLNCREFIRFNMKTKNIVDSGQIFLSL